MGGTEAAHFEARRRQHILDKRHAHHITYKQNTLNDTSNVSKMPYVETLTPKVSREFPKITEISGRLTNLVGGTNRGRRKENNLRNSLDELELSRIINSHIYSKNDQISQILSPWPDEKHRTPKTLTLETVFKPKGVNGPQYSSSIDVDLENPQYIPSRTYGKKIQSQHSKRKIPGRTKENEQFRLFPPLDLNSTSPMLHNRFSSKDYLMQW
ncbi:hypothetical protein SNEBB_001578 [Seison nebaliae]|nr:hypothetical protein SNEBB_001578 [Seison nebaliae]